MDLRKIKKSDLYTVLDEIQIAFMSKYKDSIVKGTESKNYGNYSKELCFLYNYSSTYLVSLSHLLQTEFNKLYCGYSEVYIKDFPENYPEQFVDYFGAEVVAYYISTERLNDLPINDDLRLARFIIRNKSNIIKLIKG